MNANQIEVGISFRFHCPMTGVLVTAPDHFGPSPATAFLLGPEADEFDYLSPALEPLWHEVRDAHAAGSRSPGQLFDAFCRRLGGHDHLVLFSFVPAGSRSGAPRPAVHVCIDFGYPSADGEDELTRLYNEWVESGSETLADRLRMRGLVVPRRRVDA